MKEELTKENFQKLLDQRFDHGFVDHIPGKITLYKFNIYPYGDFEKNPLKEVNSYLLDLEKYLHELLKYFRAGFKIQNNWICDQDDIANDPVSFICRCSRRASNKQFSINNKLLLKEIGYKKPAPADKNLDLDDEW